MTAGQAKAQGVAAVNRGFEEAGKESCRKSSPLSSLLSYAPSCSHPTLTPLPPTSSHSTSASANPGSEPWGSIRGNTNDCICFSKCHPNYLLEHQDHTSVSHAKLIPAPFLGPRWHLHPPPLHRKATQRLPSRPAYHSNHGEYSSGKKCTYSNIHRHH